MTPRQRSPCSCKRVTNIGRLTFSLLFGLMRTYVDWCELQQNERKLSMDCWLAGEKFAVFIKRYAAYRLTWVFTRSRDATSPLLYRSGTGALPRPSSRSEARGAYGELARCVGEMIRVDSGMMAVLFVGEGRSGNVQCSLASLT